MIGKNYLKLLYILFPSPNEDSQKHEFGFAKWNEFICVLKCEKG